MSSPVKKSLIVCISILLLASVVGNAVQFGYYNAKAKPPDLPIPFIFSTNANSRDTYFTIHNIAEAHEISKGEGIKVGILDWNFGYEEYNGLYAELIDFTGRPNNYNSGHGLWMAAVLKEIAPECEVYALGVGLDNYDEDAFVDVAIEAIDWSVENGIDILTLSLPISEANRARFDEAADRAVNSGVVTTFIHYDNPNNILPMGLLEYDEDFFRYNRQPDINVFHYDYNGLPINQYLHYLENGAPTYYTDIADGSFIPYFSLSAMSPVTAGFVAILKSVNNTLPPDEYKRILIETSHSMHFTGGAAAFENTYAEFVVDIGSAVRYLRDK